MPSKKISPQEAVRLLDKSFNDFQKKVEAVKKRQNEILKAVLVRSDKEKIIRIKKRLK